VSFWEGLYDALMTPSARRTGLVTHPVFARHDTGRGHPERAARLAAVVQRLEASGLASQMDRLVPDPAPVAWITRVHDGDYVAGVERACAAGVRVLDGGSGTSRSICDASPDA